MSDHDTFVAKIGDQIPVQLIDDPEEFICIIAGVLKPYLDGMKMQGENAHHVSEGQLANFILDALGPAGFWSTFRVKETKQQ